MNDNIWATFCDPNPADPSKRIVTVWGSAQINPNTASIQTILAVMCGRQPTAEICTDPQKYMQAASVLGLVQMFTKGMPLFANADFFINTLQGQTPFGQMIFSITGAKPFTFQSPSDMAKKFSTESKVFSLYVTGVVTINANNSSRVTIHEVVDFRGAPAIPDSITSSTTSSNPLAAAPSTTASSTANSGPSPAGSAVYYRME
jgi:general secretion pathway protein K